MPACSGPSFDGATCSAAGRSLQPKRGNDCYHPRSINSDDGSFGLFIGYSRPWIKEKAGDSTPASQRALDFPSRPSRCSRAASRHSVARAKPRRVRLNRGDGGVYEIEHHGREAFDGYTEALISRKCGQADEHHDQRIFGERLSFSDPGKPC